MTTAWAVIHQIGTAFHPEVLVEFVTGYKIVVALIVMGYLLHFASERLERGALAAFSRLPEWSYAFFVTGAIWLVMQASSSEVQPFIYFQF